MPITRSTRQAGSFLIIIGLIVLGGLLLSSRPTLAVAVRPLVIDVNADPGSTADFELTLLPGDQSENVKIDLFQASQLPSGDLSYQPADPTTYPAAGWVELEKTNVEVFPDSNVTVKGHVKIPYGAQGTHPVILMVQPDTRTGGAIGIQIRYAVRLNIQVGSVTLPPRIELKDLGVETVDKGTVVHIQVTNPTPTAFPIEGEATIRDKNRRLVTRLSLATEQARRTGGTQTRIFPGSTLKLTGTIEDVIPAGTYELRAFVRFADRGQETLTQEITLADSIGIDPDKERLALAVKPDQLIFSVPQGGLSNRTVTLVNIGNRPLIVAAFGRQIAKDYPYPIWSNFKLRSRMPVKLDAGKETSIVVGVQAKRDQEERGYYGTMVFKAWPEGADIKTDEPIAELLTPLALIVGDAGNPAVDIEGVSYRVADNTSAARVSQPDNSDQEKTGAPNGQEGAPKSETASGTQEEQQGLLAVQIHNPSKVHFEPEGQVRLTHMDGTLVGRWPLEFPKDAEAPWLSPEQTGLLTAHIPTLQSGTYQATIQVTTAGRVLGDKTESVEVP